MKKWRGAFRTLFTVTAFLVPVIAWAQYHIGDHVSDFSLKDVTGQQISLYQFSGKVIVLNFFTTW